MKTGEWKTYRTRFLVKAKQLSSALSFVDHLGRQHCGRKGDYLVESFDGVLSIAPRRIFEDIYVQMSREECAAVESAEAPSGLHSGKSSFSLKRLGVEPVEIQRIGEENPGRIPARRRTDHLDPAHGRRKSPQPCRTSRAPSHLSLM